MDRVLYVATGNAHKLAEIRAALAPLGYEVRPPSDLPEVVEDRDTFRGNALKKAQSAAAHLGQPAVSDDSGLVVPLLDGAPGVFSARFAGPDASDAHNNALLIERLEALGAVTPAAAFVCCMVLVSPDGRVIAEAEGRVEGVLRWPPEGDGGFGYDPLFFHPPSDCRFSELTREQKNAVSHRGQALRGLVAQLEMNAPRPSGSEDTP